MTDYVLHYLLLFILYFHLGCVRAQAVICWPVILEVCFQTQAITGQSSTETASSLSTLVSPCQHHSPIIHTRAFNGL